ncbi:MAG: YqgE/AlgH family protein [Pseudomonadota bacterium]
MTETLEGKLLIAMPVMTDPRFAQSVIFMCAHSDDGAMGLIVNQLSDDVTFRSLISQLDMAEEFDVDIPDPETVAERRVHVGGPVDPARGFVLHSPDYFVEGASVTVADGICLTATLEVLASMAQSPSPKDAFLALGYAGWTAGQLEAEIQANGWLHTDATTELVFATPIEDRYRRAMDQLGIDPSFLVSTSGRA